jgi:hypothetical protein
LRRCSSSLLCAIMALERSLLGRISPTYENLPFVIIPSVSII